MCITPSYIFEVAKSNPKVYELIVGKEVKHKVFGKGVITKIESNRLNRSHKYIYINFGYEIEFNEEIYNYLTEIKLDEKEIEYIKNYNKIQKLNNLAIKLTRMMSMVTYTDDANGSNIENQNNEEIKQFIKERRIAEMIHFTQLDNLESIMTNGLLSVQMLNENNIRFIRNDYNRFDNFRNAICVSIGFPNYQMFYKLRDEDISKKWAILIISPGILYEKPCAFCNGNAASYEVNSVDIRDRMGSKALKNLFNEFVDVNSGMSRRNLNIQSNHTTNPQAEVLVFDKIEPRYIKKIIFSNEDSYLCKKYTGKYKGVKVVSNNNYYSPRNDYRFWGGNHGKASSVCSE